MRSQGLLARGAIKIIPSPSVLAGCLSRLPRRGSLPLVHSCTLLFYTPVGISLFAKSAKSLQSVFRTRAASGPSALRVKRVPKTRSAPISSKILPALITFAPTWMRTSDLNLRTVRTNSAAGRACKPRGLRICTSRFILQDNPHPRWCNLFRSQPAVKNFLPSALLSIQERFLLKKGRRVAASPLLQFELTCRP